MKNNHPILIVEDNLNDIELSLAALKACNISNEIHVATDGVEALDYLFYKGKYKNRPKEIPCFALLDIKMPKLDGIDVLTEIRKSVEYKNLPVIMFTSSKMESDVVQSYHLGTNAFVVKPINFEDFIKTIKEIGFFWGVLNEKPY